MNKKINYGGPAFPRTGADGHTSPQSGMSLRDWFAGQALAGIMPSDGRPGGDANKAQWAYEIADAMLKAREGAK